MSVSMSVSMSVPVPVPVPVPVVVSVPVSVFVCARLANRDLQGKTGVTADRDKIKFRLFNSSSIFNITLREELFSLPKKNQTCCLVLVSWC